MSKSKTRRIEIKRVRRVEKLVLDFYGKENAKMIGKIARRGWGAGYGRSNIREVYGNEE